MVVIETAEKRVILIILSENPKMLQRSSETKSPFRNVK
jgi:hypothetical protein